MTKAELIIALAEDTGVTKRHAEYTLSRLICIIERSVAAGDKVTLTSFGTFDLAVRAPRVGINPSTKKPITLPAMKLPRFRPGTHFKNLVR